jgi:hypothetical protein
MPAPVPGSLAKPKDPRDRFLSRVVAGRSFAEVGGLWGTVNEKVSVAWSLGAAGLAMIDITQPGRELWTKFEERCRSLGMPDVRCVAGDVVRLSREDPALVFDVIHCSGVLYHCPEPMALLLALRRIAREHLVLTSAICPDRIETPAGTLVPPQSSGLFVPALAGREREILAAYWRPFVGEGALGLTSAVARWRPDDYAPWWWLLTRGALVALCDAAGFDCIESEPTWNGNALALLLKSRSEAAPAGA